MDMAIKAIIEHDPQGLAQLFSRYGIDADVTEKNTRNAILYFGDPFIQDLEYLQGGAQISSFLGLFESKEKREAKKAKRIAEGKTPVTLDKILAAGASIAKVITGANSEVSNETDGSPGDNGESNRLFGINKTIVFALGGLLILIVALIIHKKH